MDKLVFLLKTEYMTGQQLISLINYFAQAGQASNAKAFVRKLAQRVPQHRDELMTIAEQLEQEGIKKGRKEGILLGEQRGEQRGIEKVARTMLQNGLDRNMVMDMTGLTEDALTKIHH